ncbi:carbamoyl-phosphate synthase L chain [Synechococcus sp. W4D4]|uniref:carbamoyl-phosphate synthase L chain n=1 Tax=Synechococcus sp. W4D4 TaxID=3392294 RepID=UPI0039ECF807
MSLTRPFCAAAATAFAFATLPSVNAEPAVAQGSASDLGVMSIQLKDIVKPQVGIQGQTQAAGTPNQAGLGGFLPLVVGSNSVFFADVLANANFADINNSSSIINTTVAGTTISTSSRLGYRWLNGDRSWMYGLNAGYDTRPMSTGPADTGIPVYASRTAFFQQAAVNAEAVSDKWRFNAYGLIPTGEVDQQLNSVYKGGVLTTVGLDAGYNVTPSLLASLGGYYQNGDVDDDGNPEVDNVGILGRLAYAINNEVSIGANLSYDDSFDTRFSADIKWRFNTNGGPGKETPKSNAAVSALTSTPSYRDVRVHDICGTGACVIGVAVGQGIATLIKLALIK